MVSEKKVKELENSEVELSLTVSAEDAASAYDKLLKKYVKTAHIKGFRKGKVPPKVLETKYGDALKEESMMNIMDEALKEALDEIDDKHKPLPYSSPTLVNEDSLSLELDKDFSFSVTYEVYPTVSIEKFSGYEIEVPSVAVSDEDILRELQTLQDQNALVTETDSPVDQKSIITVNFWEVDEEGIELPDTRREDFTFTVGTGYNRYQIDEEVVGMGKGDSRVIEKIYPEDFPAADLAGKTVKLQVEVVTVKRRDIPELDDEFAQDISEKYETLEDLKQDIQKRLNNDLENSMNDLKVGRVIKKIIEDNPFTLPSSMIDAQIEQSWKRYIGQYQIPEEQMLKLLEIQGMTKESITAEWKESTVVSLKQSIIMQSIADVKKIEVPEEELNEEFEKEMKDAPQDMQPEVRDYYREMTKDQLKTRKAARLLIESSSFTEGSSMSLQEFLQGKAEQTVEEEHSE